VRVENIGKPGKDSGHVVAYVAEDHKKVRIIAQGNSLEEISHFLHICIPTAMKVCNGRKLENWSGTKRISSMAQYRKKNKQDCKRKAPC
jgi:hypothetical protein